MPRARAQGTCRAGVGSEGELDPAPSACDAAEGGAALEVCLRGIGIGIAGVAAVVVVVAAAAAAWVDSGAGVEAAGGGGLYACAQPRVGDSCSSEAWLGLG